MKKTLIALAAVAATSAAFAQNTVSITGNIAAGYQQTKAADGTKAKGMGLDEAVVNFAVTEDLGGGLKLTARTGFNVADGFSKTVAGGEYDSTKKTSPVSGAVQGRNTSISLAGGFGTVLLGNIEIVSGIRAVGTAGAPVTNLEGELLDPSSNGTDILSYTAPAINGFTFSASVTEEKGLGDGLSSDQAGIGYTAGVSYAAGPLSALLNFSSWDKATAEKRDNRYRAAVSYDFGMVAVGAGVEDISGVLAADDKKMTIIGVKVPVSAQLTLGVARATNKVGTTEKRTGTTFGAEYALSKRTSITADYVSYEATAGATNKTKATTFLVNHSF